jgi:hypothetical protein
MLMLFCVPLPKRYFQHLLELTEKMTGVFAKCLTNRIRLLVNCMARVSDCRATQCLLIPRLAKRDLNSVRLWRKALILRHLAAWGIAGLLDRAFVGRKHESAQPTSIMVHVVPSCAIGYFRPPKAGLFSTAC